MHTALNSEGKLINPHTGSTIWFHGSGRRFKAFDGDVVWLAKTEDDAASYGDRIYHVEVRPDRGAKELFDPCVDLFNPSMLPNVARLNAFEASLNEVTPGARIDNIIDVGAQRIAGSHPDLWALFSGYNALGSTPVANAFREATAGFSPIERFAAQAALAGRNYTAVQLLFRVNLSVPESPEIEELGRHTRRFLVEDYFGFVESEYATENPPYIGVLQRYAELNIVRRSMSVSV